MLGFTSLDRMAAAGAVSLSIWYYGSLVYRVANAMHELGLDLPLLRAETAIRASVGVPGDGPPPSWPRRLPPMAGFGLQAVAEHYLRALIDAGVLHVVAAAAFAEEDRILAADAHASPTVHPVTVADPADEFARLDLTEPATSHG